MKSRKENLDSSEFRRCESDGECPYAMLPIALLRHKKMSPECIALLSYLLSHCGEEDISTEALLKHYQGRIGRDRIRELVNEAMEYGYIERHVTNENNLSGVVYNLSNPSKKEIENLRGDEI